MAKPRTSKTHTTPAPVGGWNARDALPLMAETDAVQLKNVIPQTTGCRIRPGHREHASLSGAGAVTSLFSYQGTDGTDKLIGALENASSINALYDFTTLNGTPSILSDPSSGYTSNVWQGFNFKGSGDNGRLILVNGADTPQQYADDTSPPLSDITYTGISDSSKLIQGCSYRHRVYFIEKDSTSIWYGEVRAISGTLREFDVGSLLTRGGYPMFVTTWSYESGDGLADYIVIVSSEGEILVYSGDYPSNPNWQIIKHAYQSRPLGRRAYVQKEGDVILILRGGCVPMSEIFAPSGRDRAIKKFTDKIDNAFSDAANLNASYGSWEGVYYADANQIWFNVPNAGDEYADQYCQNVLNGSWWKQTQMNARCWCLHEGKPYFGGASGTVYEADYEADDNGDYIPIDIQTAYSYLGNRGMEKHVNLARPNVVTNASGEIFNYEVSMDFVEVDVSAAIQVDDSSAHYWDEAYWAGGGDSPEWSWGASEQGVSEWYSVTGLGRACSSRIVGNFKDISLEISTIDYNFVPGGVL